MFYVDGSRKPSHPLAAGQRLKQFIAPQWGLTRLSPDGLGPRRLVGSDVRMVPPVRWWVSSIHGFSPLPLAPS